MVDKKRGKKVQALSIIVNLILATFAFSILVSKEVIASNGELEDPLDPGGESFENFDPQSEEAHVKKPPKNLIPSVIPTDKLSEFEASIAEGDLDGAEKILESYKGTEETSSLAEEALAKAKSGDVDGALGIVKKMKEEERGSSWLSRALGATHGMAFDALLTGVQWAGIMFGIGQMIGSLAGLDEGQQKAISSGLAAGAFTWKFLPTVESEAAFACRV